MGKQIKQFCKIISESVKRGTLSKQQGKTLIGQAKHGGIEVAKTGLERMFKDA